MANQPKKYKKFVATAATATLVASAIVPVASAAGFTDVANNSHEEAINALAEAGIINGYADGTFKPNQTINRGQVVKLLGRWLETEGFEAPADWDTKQYFNDLPVTAEKELVKYAALAKDAGVFAGSNGNLNFTQTMQRQQMAVVLVRAINEIYEVDLVKEYKAAKFKSEISDLDKAFSAEQREAITALEYAELTNAANLPGKSFKPADSITRGQFASFLYRTINMEVSTPASASVKAINNTTVEVTFDKEVENVQALNFEIKDLEVKNAAVKQTNKKVVVLTTAPQTADKEYTVSLNAEEVGKFKGVSAVNPTKVELITPATQGKLGQQVTVKAKVSVAEGQSKAGIPVTFYVPGNNNDGVTPTLTGEAITDENGVASYSYTRYKDGTDEVTAYATGDRSKFSLGYVFWGVDTILSIQEVTTGATINNGADKTYKVTYKNPKTGLPEANKTFNVGFVENMNVTSDKVSNATVNGINALQLSNNTALAAAKITTDSKGEASFTVSGANTAVTPVVFAPNTATGEKAEVYKASALQATTSKVTFGALQAQYTIEVNRDGGEVAARYEGNGRQYKVVVKDKDGKLAKNEIVNVAFNEDLDRVISTNTEAKFIEVDKDDNQKYYPTTAAEGKNTAKQISVKTNDKGEATFVIGSDKENDYATPVAWIDINTSNAKQGRLDEGEPKTVSQISYFQNAYLDGASVKAYKKVNGKDKATTKFEGNETATFRAELVNQSNQKMSNTSVKKVTYTIFNTGGEDVVVDGKTISPNRSWTVTKEIPGSTELRINTDNKTTSVKVSATGVAINTDGKDYAFTSKEATADFTSTVDVAKEYTGRVVAVSDKEIEFEDRKAISLKDATFYDLSGAQIHGAEEFKKALVEHKNVYVSYDADKKTFRIARVVNDGGIVVNAAPTLKTAQITKPAGTTNAVAATSNTISLDSKPKLTIGSKSYTFNANAASDDYSSYKNATDLVTKIKQDTSTHTVSATVVSPATTADTAGIQLIGNDKGDAFSYQIDDLKPVYVNNGKAGSGIVSAKQQITFTFTTSVNLNEGDDVQVIANGSTTAAKVAKVDANKVVIEFDPSLAAGTIVTDVKVKVDGVWTTVKSPLADKSLSATTSVVISN
ncbi:S-layer homology domain-containing protein [Lysinibacillus xylanilyticus]|uniref:S-layer homology domain-containing protein n=1 Tax=Lysinibacillus xylanilyticus TaxID=582475 RepID=UPI003D020D5E